MNSWRALKILLSLIGVLLPLIAQGQDFSYTTNASAIAITGYTGPAESVLIPGTIDGLPVTSIGDWAFYLTDVTNVVIPDSVTNVGDGAFFDCDSLSTLTVGNSVVNIGDWAFAFCPSLTAVNFRGSSPSLGGANVFYGNLATIYYLQQTTDWGATFDSHPAVLWNPPVPYDYTVNNDDTVTIEQFTGSNTVVQIPSAIAFLPVASIGEDSFYYNTSIASVTIPSSVNSIEEGAFLNCFGLTNITMPNSVTTIGADAFTGTSLSSIFIPGSVTNIAAGSLDNCSLLTEITVDPQNLFYSSVNGVLFDVTRTILVRFPEDLGGNYAIRTNVINFGIDAFAECNLTSIAIPSSIQSVPLGAFFGCASLTNILFASGVTSIGYDSFGNCSGLKDITIPGTLTNIGVGAFSGCTGLTNVTIANGVVNISDYAFAVCSFNSITIPSSVLSIGYETFGSNPSLTSVYFMGDAPILGPYAFDGANGVTLYYLPGTTGWASFDSEDNPVEVWLPKMQTINYSIGVVKNQFGFNIAWASGQTVVVEACTNLANPVWSPLETNILIGSSTNFSDLKWTNCPSHFYRIASE